MPKIALRTFSGFRRGSAGGGSSALARWRMTRYGIASGTAAYTNVHTQVGG